MTGNLFPFEQIFPVFPSSCSSFAVIHTDWFLILADSALAVLFLQIHTTTIRYPVVRPWNTGPRLLLIVQ